MYMCLRNLANAIWNHRLIAWTARLRYVHCPFIWLQVLYAVLSLCYHRLRYVHCLFTWLFRLFTWQFLKPAQSVSNISGLFFLRFFLVNSEKFHTFSRPRQHPSPFFHFFFQIWRRPFKISIFQTFKTLWVPWCVCISERECKREKGEKIDWINMLPPINHGGTEAKHISSDDKEKPPDSLFMSSVTSSWRGLGKQSWMKWKGRNCKDNCCQ